MRRHRPRDVRAGGTGAGTVAEASAPDRDPVTLDGRTSDVQGNAQSESRTRFGAPQGELLMNSKNAARIARTVMSITTCALIACVPTAQAAPPTRQKCDAALEKRVSVAASKYLRCLAKAVRDGASNTYPCETAMRTRFYSFPWKQFCSVESPQLAFPPHLLNLGDASRAALAPNATPSNCAAKKLSAVGKRAAEVLKAYADTTRGSKYDKLAAVSLQLDASLTRDFSLAENAEDDCQTMGDAAALTAIVRQFLDDVVLLENSCEVVSPAAAMESAFGSWAQILRYATDQGFAIDGSATICPNRSLLLAGAPIETVTASLVQATTGERASLLAGSSDDSALLVRPELGGALALVGPEGGLRLHTTGQIEAIEQSFAITSANARTPTAACGEWFRGCMLARQTLTLAAPVTALLFSFPVLAAGSPIVTVGAATAELALLLREATEFSHVCGHAPACPLPEGSEGCAEAAHCSALVCVAETLGAEPDGTSCGTRRCLAADPHDPRIVMPRCTTGLCRDRLDDDCSLYPPPMHCEGSPAECVPGEEIPECSPTSEWGSGCYGTGSTSCGGDPSCYPASCTELGGQTFSGESFCSAGEVCATPHPDCCQNPLGCCVYFEPRCEFQGRYAGVGLCQDVQFQASQFRETCVTEGGRYFREPCDLLPPDPRTAPTPTPIPVPTITPTPIQCRPVSEWTHQCCWGPYASGFCDESSWDAALHTCSYCQQIPSCGNCTIDAQHQLNSCSVNGGCDHSSSVGCCTHLEPDCYARGRYAGIYDRETERLRFINECTQSGGTYSPDPCP